MTLFLDLLFGKSADQALGDYGYTNYIQEWYELFGTADAGTRHYWPGNNKKMQSVIVYRLTAAQFAEQKQALAAAVPGSWDELAAELALLM